MMRFKKILLEDYATYSEPITVDIDTVFPVEAYTIYADIKMAEQYYLNQETTQYLIALIKSGQSLNPIKVAPFPHPETYSYRNRAVLANEIPKYKYSIEDGCHRYFAYKFCHVQMIPVVVMQNVWAREPELQESILHKMLGVKPKNEEAEKKYNKFMVTFRNKERKKYITNVPVTIAQFLSQVTIPLGSKIIHVGPAR